MRPINTFKVVPSLPAPLEGLRELAFNLRWAWDHDTIELFRRLDSELWEASGHNPVLMLGSIDQARLDSAVRDPGLMAHLARVREEMENYKSDGSTWFQRRFPDVAAPMVAYFSAEFGLTECLSIFAGGLGVLAGDHLKSASDLGVPLVGVGLLYQQGYFRQYLNDAGWQQEAYENNDFHNLPLTPLRRADGNPLTVQVRLVDHPVTAQVWQVQVGRLPLYLLDTNLPVNRPAERYITDQLYGGDLEMRLRQEIVLGIGGYRALGALGIQPTVYHMNEGHSAFLALERIKQLMETHRLTSTQAREAASAGMVFTTHTPVAAGHDYFPPQLMDRYFGDALGALGIPRQEFLGLGRQNPNDDGEQFCMTTLALRLAAYSNGVSRLHGEVSRRVWRGMWPRVPEPEIPITYVTNGVHFQSWISRDMKELYDRYLGPRWREEPADRKVWQAARHISGEELWRTHERRRERLVAFCRRRLLQQMERRGASQAALEAADEVLDPGALTIGFARRFATYKRATLILRDLDRLARVLNDADRPVQIIFAGKAHPRDDPGKQLIQQIVTFARQERFRRRIVFLEDYDAAVARYLVQGADVWLNTPLRLQEASGTSGMKAAANGVLNMSILDGWWDEAYQPQIGWAIGRGETYNDAAYQDQIEAEALYELLEQEVVPMFYDRGPDRLPRRWITRVKDSLEALCGAFTTHRMVGEYTERFYVPAAARYRELTGADMARGKALADWKGRVRDGWSQVRVDQVSHDGHEDIQVGADLRVQACVRLGALTPEDVCVHLYWGNVDASDELRDAQAAPMTMVKQEADGSYVYEVTALRWNRSGLFGYTVRVLPCHTDLATPFLPGIIAWA